MGRWGRLTRRPDFLCRLRVARVTLFVQGMRRSGTTILYDALLEDPALECFYEPLREDDVTVGGGSGAREADAFALTRDLRDIFRGARYPDIDPREFNWGGPRAPTLEVGGELPEHCVEFIRSLVERPAETAIKFTRAYDKLERLTELDPEAALVHVVRDPRAVAASIMLGRDRRQASRFDDAGEFFAARSKRKLWSCRAIAQVLLKRPEYADLGRPTDVERILLVWRHTFESTWRDGRRLFGDRYVLLRNEELRADPRAALRLAYAAIGREPPGEVLSWAAGAVRGAEEPYEAGHDGWRSAFVRVGLRDALAAAGYDELADATPTRGAGARLAAGGRRGRRQVARLIGR